MKDISSFQTPVVFIFFNRIECTKKVFSSIRDLKPMHLYLVSDGARNEEENIVVKEIRGYIEKSIDWECDIHREYSDVNLGCKKRVSSGISWVFETEEQAIILEDDCVPNRSFFFFCDELLKKYRYEDKVMTISGNLNVPDYTPQFSYIFSRFLHVWGWATWKRAWSLYDIEMRDYPSNKEIMNWLNPKLRAMKRNEFDLVYNCELDTWDFQWQYCIWKNEGLCIKPNVNTIENIGFDELATHTKTRSKLVEKLSFSSIEFPLTHPMSVELDKKYDELLTREYLENCPSIVVSIIKRLLRKIKRFLRF